MKALLKAATSSFLALALALSVSVPAFAAGEGTSSSAGEGTTGNTTASINLTELFKNVVWKYDKTGKNFGQSGCPGIYTHSGNKKADDANGWLRWDSFMKRWRTKLSGAYGDPSIKSMEAKIKDPAIWEEVKRLRKENFLTPAKAAETSKKLAKYTKVVTKEGGSKVRCWIVGTEGTSYINWIGRLIGGEIELADAIWVKTRVVNEKEYKTKLIKSTINNRTTFNISRKTAEQIWNDSSGDQPYQYTFGSNSENVTVVGTYQKIECKIRKEQVIEDGKWVDKKVTKTYRKTSTKINKKRVIQYGITAPTIDVRYYQPLNLNTNTFATNEFMRKHGYGTWGTNAGNVTYAGNLDGSVNNGQDIVDGAAIQSVDMNNATKYNVTLGTQFGMPTSDMTFAKSVGKYKDSMALYNANKSNVINTCWVNSDAGNSGGSSVYYDLPGYYSENQYGALRFQYGVAHGNNSSSIQLGNKGESVNDASIAYDPSNANTIAATGGLFAGQNGLACNFRSIKEGSYNLTSEKSDQWWMDEYEQGKEYTVGCTVNGWIKSEKKEITAPEVKNQGSVIVGGSAPINQVVMTAKTVVQQPVLYGLFQVGTVRGNVER